MTTDDSRPWPAYFLAQGHPSATLLGTGMEGVVYDPDWCTPRGQSRPASLAKPQVRRVQICVRGGT